MTAHDRRIDLTIDGGETIQHIPVVPGRQRARRWAFWCPGDCGRRVEKVYELDGKFQCYRCHNLTFQFHSVWRNAAAWCAIRLRQEIGVPDTLCGPLPPWAGPTHGWRAWRGHRAYDRAVSRIRAYESRLLTSLIRFTIDLERWRDEEVSHERHEP